MLGLSNTVLLISASVVLLAASATDVGPLSDIAINGSGILCEPIDDGASDNTEEDLTASNTTTVVRIDRPVYRHSVSEAVSLSTGDTMGSTDLPSATPSDALTTDPVFTGLEYDSAHGVFRRPIGVYSGNHVVNYIARPAICFT